MRPLSRKGVTERRQIVSDQFQRMQLCLRGSKRQERQSARSLATLEERRCGGI